MLPSLLPAQFQKRFSTVIRDVATTGNSGSGVFDADRGALLSRSWRPYRSKPAPRDGSFCESALQRSDTAVHEWVGLLVYWLTKRSSELFPGPTQDAL
jgi:hypothetical protein